MFSRLSFRSVRSLSAALAVAALVLTLAVPVQAAPRLEGASIFPDRLVEQIAGWVQALFVALDPSSAPRTEEDLAVIDAASGSCIDPLGNPIPCPEDD